MWKNCTILTETNNPPPPHLVCHDCRINLFRHSSQPNCPLCLPRIYTLSLSFYYRCFPCNQIKKCATSSNQPHKIVTRTFYILCVFRVRRIRTIAPSAWKRLTPTTFGQRIPERRTSFLSRFLFSSPSSSPSPSAPLTILQHKQVYIATHKKKTERVAARRAATRFKTRF